MFQVMLIVAALSPVMGSRIAADEQTSVWELRGGDRFIVNVFVVKHTEVTVGEKPPVTSDTRDRFEIEYRVLEVLKTGDVVLAARLRRSVRETGESSPGSLKTASQSKSTLEDLRIRIQVDPAGQVLPLDELERESVLSTLSGVDPATVRLFRDSCPEEVIAGWFGRPFWTASDSTEANGQIPERSDSLSFGPFGTMRTQLTITTRPAADLRREYLIAGKGRFVPLVVPESIGSQKTVLLTDVVAELEEYSGKVTAPGDSDAEEPPEDVPRSLPFQSMDLTVRFQGSGMFQTSENSPRQKLLFRQTQVQSWILTSHTFGRPEVPLGIPVPPDVR
jgi:hypothetical protein